MQHGKDADEERLNLLTSTRRCPMCHHDTEFSADPTTLDLNEKDEIEMVFCCSGCGFGITQVIGDRMDILKLFT